MTFKEWLLGFEDGSYHHTSPMLKWHRLIHFFFGPLRGCSCSGPGIPGHRPALLASKQDGSCFHSPWRIEYPARMGYSNNIRIAKLERALKDAGIEIPR